MEISNLLSVTLRKNPDFDPKQVDINKVEQQVQALLQNKGAADTAVFNGKEINLFGSDGMISKGIYQIIDPSKLKDDAISIITTCWDISDNELIDILINSTNTQPEQIRIVKIGDGNGSSESIPKLKFNSLRSKSSNNAGGTDNPSDPSNPNGPNGPDDPSDPSDPNGGGTGPEIPENINYTLSRKTDNNKTIIVSTTDETVIKLTNSIDGKEYYYKIKAKTGNQNVKLEFLDNNRFLIFGSYIEIVACDGQDDDIILIGSNNTLDTNSGNDIVRVGGAADSGGYFFSEEYGYTFNASGLIEESGVNKHNTIYTGSGKDYITIIGDYNNIDSGSDEDRYYDYWKDESDNVFNNVENEFEYGVGTSDGKLGWAQQGYYGDCKYLSFLNSLSVSGNSLSKYVNITKSGNNYTVTFKNANVTPKSCTVYPSDINDENRVKGDLDNVLCEIAFRKLIEARGIYIDDREPSFGSTLYNYLISEYFFGSSEAMHMDKTQPDPNRYWEIQFKMLLNAYKNGDISNLTVGTDEGENEKLGILSGHAYCIKGGEADEYVLLSNPHDGNDIIKLDWNDFVKYFETVLLYGDAAEYVRNSTTTFYNMIVSDENGLNWHNYNIGINYAPGLGISNNEDLEITEKELNEMEKYISVVKGLINIDKKFELYS